MDTNSIYPQGLDSLPDPDAEDALSDNTVPHAQLHQKVNNAIEAIQYTLGTNPQGDSANITARLNAIEQDIDSIGTNAINELIDGSLTTNKLQDKAVTSVKIGDGEVKEININTAAVTNVKIAPVTITGDKLVPQTITYTQLKPFTKIHVSRPHSTPITLASLAAPAVITWTDELSSDPDALTAASPVGSSTKYSTPQSMIQIPADSSYSGTYMISLHLEGLRGNFLDSVYVTIKNGSNQIVNTFYANSGGTGAATISSHLNHLVDLQPSYSIQVSGYNSHASPAYMAGDLYVLKVSN